MELDLDKMVREIDGMVSTDFGFEMEVKLLPDAPPYTQEEAREMANTLARVYSIAHSIHCRACGLKYITPPKQTS